MLNGEFATKGDLNERVLSDFETKVRDRPTPISRLPTLEQRPLCHP